MIDVRESFRLEFLEALRDSPAWNLLIKTMLKGMHFVQDDATFTMGNVPQSFNLRKEFILEGAGLYDGIYAVQQDEVLKVRVDINNCPIRATNCRISNDGKTWFKELNVKEEFYLRSTTFQAVEDIVISINRFYPDSIAGSDMNQLLNLAALDRDDVTFSEFGKIFTATSPYLIHYVLQRLGIDYNMEYLFEDNNVEYYGIKQERVRDCIGIHRFSGEMFAYYTTLTLVPFKDKLVTESGIYDIKACNDNILLCSCPEDVGIFSVQRTDYLVPLLDKKLISALQLEFPTDLYAEARRFIPRVTPVRCVAGFRGDVDLRLRTILGLKSEAKTNTRTLKTDINISSVISQAFNEFLDVFLSHLYEDDVRLVQRSVSENLYEEILLV